MSGVTAEDFRAFCDQSNAAAQTIAADLGLNLQEQVIGLGFNLKELLLRTQDRELALALCISLLEEAAGAIVMPEADLDTMQTPKGVTIQ